MRSFSELRKGEKAELDFFSFTQYAHATYMLHSSKTNNNDEKARLETKTIDTVFSLHQPAIFKSTTRVTMFKKHNVQTNKTIQNYFKSCY